MTALPTVQRVCILGATGSVGGSTLDVIALHPGRYEVFALTAFQKVRNAARAPSGPPRL